MKHVIAGTAGHIDHGKTSLVRALTGIDTDRLDEEKRRGISIELGFAHLDLAHDLRVAFIDVPGHERFIKNMLAGVAGIDFVVFVIAADESIKPQTREHFDICRLLRIPTGLIALAKSDLVDAETLEVVKLEIADFVKDSFLENAAVIPVSAAMGLGLTDIKTELSRLAKQTWTRDAARHFSPSRGPLIHHVGLRNSCDGHGLRGLRTRGRRSAGLPGRCRISSARNTGSQQIGAIRLPPGSEPR